MSLKPTPTSRARTAYDLCQDVIEVIQQEPKRLDMTVICSLDQSRSTDPMRPACGTVGCFAGWVSVLALGRETASKKATFTACQILGGHKRIKFYFNDATPAKFERVSAKGNSYVFNAGEGDGCSAFDGGTRDLANAVIARIKRFMEANASALRARKLTPRVLDLAAAAS